MALSSILVIRQQHLFLLEGAVGAVIAVENIVIVAGEEAVQPEFFGVFEIESNAAFGGVADMEG